MVPLRFPYIYQSDSSCSNWGSAVPLLDHNPLERFLNDCRKTKTKAITPTNHNRNEQRDEPITILSNHL